MILLFWKQHLWSCGCGKRERPAGREGSQTGENTPEHLNCLEALSVLLIVCSSHLSFNVFYLHSHFAIRSSLTALAQKGRSLLAEKVKVFVLFNIQRGF